MKILEYRKWANGTTLSEFIKLGGSGGKKHAVQMQGSQNGEDGVIEEILKRLKIDSGWVCEFGAINGKEISNTFQLVKRGFKAVMIEPLKPQFDKLLQTVKEYPNIIPIWKAIEHRVHYPYHLDQILKETPIPKDFDILSIDTDGFDYQIWEGFIDYKPKLVIIETSPYIPGEYIFQANHENQKEYGDGSSFLSMLKLGKRKGYTYFGFVSGNTFWIRNDLAEKLGDLLMSKEEVNKQIERYNE